ncbi:hypothetical protein [Actinoplanes solisilvae]|uniref:hypothetical protein n=1 Tax=Actinoplanes solisilvae TaxID=2486853 RepID=UPI000FDA1F36|nr:hypothetical protein [Actinoplanes solisilvae]
MVKPSKDNGGKRLLGLGAVLLLAACQLPELIKEGGWRGWVASVMSAITLLVFVLDLRDVVRRRWAARRGDQHQ